MLDKLFPLVFVAVILIGFCWRLFFSGNKKGDNDNKGKKHNSKSNHSNNEQDIE